MDNVWSEQTKNKRLADILKYYISFFGRSNGVLFKNNALND